MSDVRPEPPRLERPSSFDTIISRFWGFDHLLGGSLIKLVYYIGLFGICLWTLLALLGSVNAMGYSPGAGLGAIIVTLVAAVFGVVVWRVTCELWLLIFQIHDRLGEIRDRLGPR